MVVELIKDVYWNVDNIYEIDNMALYEKIDFKISQILSTFVD